MPLIQTLPLGLGFARGEQRADVVDEDEIISRDGASERQGLAIVGAGPAGDAGIEGGADVLLRHQPLGVRGVVIFQRLLGVGCHGPGCDESKCSKCGSAHVKRPSIFSPRAMLRQKNQNRPASRVMLKVDWQNFRNPAVMNKPLWG